MTACAAVGVAALSWGLIASNAAILIAGFFLVLLALWVADMRRVWRRHARASEELRRGQAWGRYGPGDRLP